MPRPAKRRMAVENTVRKVLAEAGAEGAVAEASLSADGRLSVAVKLPAGIDVKGKDVIAARLGPLPISVTVT